MRRLFDMVIGRQLAEDLKNASYVRKMFEQGEELKRIYGDESVFDFSLGNPYVEPPEGVFESMARHASDRTPGVHRYMNNAGLMDVREAVARHVSRRRSADADVGVLGRETEPRRAAVSGKGRAGVLAAVRPEHVVMTVGAAGGINIALKTLLNPGDEVVAIAPYFLEYNFYAANHGGTVVPVMSDSETFRPNADAIAAAVTPRTRAIIINSPNNPTGVVYDAECLTEISDALKKRERELGTVIYVISDEPYSSIVYDGALPPHIFNYFDNAIIVNSYSKSLALPGERIGYVVVSPNAEDADQVAAGLIFCNRVLGFVNAPAVFQLVVKDNLDVNVDIGAYAEKRDAICGIMREAGFNFVTPKGAFYLFPKIMGDDEEAFKEAALRHNILIVPGAGFNCPGHFRLAFCIDTGTIARSREAFLALAAEYR